MPKNIFKSMVEFNNIEYCYNKCLNGYTKYSKEAIEFSNNETYNLLKLQEEIIESKYKPGEFIELYVYEPKKRLIHAPHFRDKIVQRMIYNELSKIYDPIFIKDSYGSIRGKGMHRCLEQIHHYLKKSKWEYGDGAYIIKIDIEKFFYNIGRENVKSRLPIKTKDINFLNFIYGVIDHAKTISDIGLPLGNTSSQVLANILMDKLDKYAKCKLGLRYYCRYMDDIFIVVENKTIAKEIFNDIKEYTKENLELNFNKKKSQIFPIAQGVNMVGFKIQTTHRLLRSESKNNMKRKIKKLERLYLEGRVTKSKVEQIVNSWYGHAKYGNCYSLVNGLIEKNSIYGLNKDKIIIKE